MHRFSILVVIALFTIPLSARQEPSPPPPQPPFAAAVSAVVVDAVVRDRRGNPVTDLRKEDFELFEDGVRQEIADLTVIHVADPPAGSRAGRPGEAVGARTAPSFTAIVFDRLAPDVRAQAARAAHALVDTMRADDFAGVFLVDQSLRIVQNYTTDRAALRRALDAVADMGSAVYDLKPNMGAPIPENAETNAEFQERAIEAVRAGQATQDAWDSIEALQRGYATTGALLAITSGLGVLPGRKSVAFFAHGVAVPDDVLRSFRDVIGQANRNNVSVYSIDASGLRVHSNEAEIGQRLHVVGPYAGSARGGGVADAMRTPRTSLMLLARETGGFFSENTNDLARAAARVAADRRFHYLLTYTPTDTNFDGNWRTLTLRVPGRRGVEVRARSGYLATAAPVTLGLLAYEAPALTALERSPAPADLPLRAAALVFPDGEQSRIAILAATDAASLRFDRDGTVQTYRTDFSILARIVDGTGEVVRKSSEPYRLNGPVQQLEQARRGEVLFFRQPLLGPGSYTLEVAVHDALASQSGVQRVPFTVPASTDALQVSSLVLVARAERAAGSEEGNNPLRVGEVVVYPNLGEPLRKSRDKALTFLVVAKSSGGAVATATLEVLEDGQPIAQAPTGLPPPDASGRIEHIAQIPLASFAPGRYTLRLTVSAGPQHAVRDAVFEVIE